MDQIFCCLFKGLFTFNFVHVTKTVNKAFKLLELLTQGQTKEKGKKVRKGITLKVLRHTERLLRVFAVIWLRSQMSSFSSLIALIAAASSPERSNVISEERH